MKVFNNWSYEVQREKLVQRQAEHNIPCIIESTVAVKD